MTCLKLRNVFRRYIENQYGRNPFETVMLCYNSTIVLGTLWLETSTSRGSVVLAPWPGPLTGGSTQISWVLDVRVMSVDRMEYGDNGELEGWYRRVIRGSTRGSSWACFYPLVSNTHFTNMFSNLSCSWLLTHSLVVQKLVLNLLPLQLMI